MGIVPGLNRIVGILLIFGATAASASAEQGRLPTAAEQRRVIGLLAPPLSSGQANWLQSHALTNDRLRGKGVLLLFAEASDQETWRDWNAAAQAFAGRPIIFIAIVPGATRQELEQFAKTNEIHWPIHIDPARTTASTYGLGVIGDGNPRQIAAITPDGSALQFGPDDFEGAANAVLEGAKWEIDPLGLTESVLPIWFAIEFGYASTTYGKLLLALKSTDEATKSGAEILQSNVNAYIKRRIDEAIDTEGRGAYYDAYLIYAELSDRFRPFGLPKSVDVARKELLKYPEVPAAISAKVNLESARRLIVAGRDDVALVTLRKIVADMQENSLGLEARKILDRLENP